MVDPLPSRGAEDPLDGLIADCLARMSLGEDDALAELCRANPEHAAELRRRHQGLVALGLWQRPANTSPQRIGAYELVRELGRGGMGVVHLAQQHAPIRRLAALKVIAGRATAHALARFEAERQVLAMLVHPNIAQVLEAGATAEGQPWYAMEFVDGRPIAAYCDEHGLDVEARLMLFLQLADAVQFAHQQGVLHRDLKPGNVLVCERGGKASVKVIDFGLAKALHDPFGERHELTEEGQILGTPEYMSPEQAMPTAAGIDTRTDVYALGAILYELLAGVLPFDFPALRRQGFRALQQAVCEREAPCMSTRLQELGEDKRARRLVGDLDWICAKALRKEREQRYASASEFAADVRRHLHHEPVLAGPLSTVYQLRKFARRHRLAVAFSAVLALGVLVALVVVTALLGQRDDTLRGFDALDDADRFADLKARVDDDLWRSPERLAAFGNLWPATPDRLDEFDAWLAAMATLSSRLPDLQDRLQALRAKAALEPYERSLLRRLEPLIADLGKAGEPGGIAAIVRGRREWAAGLPALTVTGPEAAARWREAIATIADEVRCPRYKGLVVAPQMGLLPLGRDERSGLYEFAYPQPGFTPPRRENGRLAITADSCMVFVLIPAGEVRLGVDWPDDRLPAGLKPLDTEYVPTKDRTGGQGIPCHIEPFFLGKYEVTHAQWEGLFGAAGNPSYYSCQTNLDLNPTRTHPVNTVSPRAADEAVRRLGLTLPTSAQWQYAARGGAAAPWWTGFAEDSWYGAENLADLSLGRRTKQQNQFGQPDMVYDDLHPLTCAVDAMQPNPFGLFQVLGNVMECSRDPAAKYAAAEPRGPEGAMTPLQPDATLNPRSRDMLGGSFFHAFVQARSTRRDEAAIDQAGRIYGVRPSRRLTATDTDR